MYPGDLVVGRFLLERIAGEGGMGVVYRAEDRLSGRPVAMKFVPAARGSGANRFLREARLISELRHTGIVQHVAHGVLPSGALYLAMEWLEGEDLAHRLARAPLQVDDAIALTTRVAEALGYAHGRGVVHRDVKPANLWLVECDVRQPKVLDFGVALASESLRLTRTGVAVGTPGYMAPEQARGRREIDARADVFALGSVLFECLTGEPPFVGETAVAVLAKLVLEEAPRVSDVRSDVSPALDDLCARMLSRDPDKRPADGTALVAELGAIARSGAPAPTSPRAVARREQRLLSLVLVRRPPAPAPSAAEQAFADTVVLDEATGDEKRELRALAERHGAEIEALADGSYALLWGGSGEARDDAARAARCALALAASLPDAAIAMAAGRVERTDGGSVGEVIDRAARLVEASGRGVSSVRGDGDPPSEAGASGSELRSSTLERVAIDDVAAALLDGRFVLVRGPDGVELVTEVGAAERERLLLGRPTPFVGRETELSMLGSLTDHVVAYREARAALVTSPAGVGKTRLISQFVKSVRDRHPSAIVLRARADAMRVGTPYGLAIQLVRADARIRAAEPTVERAARLAQRLGELHAGDAARHAREFIGELLGLPSTAAASPDLVAARADARLMGEQLRGALEHWLAAVCRAAPLVVCLDDVQWGDAATMLLLDGSLGRLREEPLCIVAFGRPEVDELFPGLWESRELQRLRLGPLSRKASERIVRGVLGESASPADMGRLIERAAGNAFFLEELIRAAAEGRGDVLPPTVLAVAQARLDALEPDLRRAARAASVFGEAFSRAGVARLLGLTGEGSSAAFGLCEELVRNELVERRRPGRFAGDHEYAFRHELVREAAYGLFTPADREVAHRACAEWLEEEGERDALVLAEHYRRGAALDKAVLHYVAAAEQALQAADPAQVLVLAERGIEVGASGEARGALRELQSLACVLRHENARALGFAEEAMQLLPRTSGGWARAAGQTLVLATGAGQLEQVFAVVETLEASAPDALRTGAHGQALAAAAYGMFILGQTARLRAILEKLEASPPVLARDPMAMGWVACIRAFHDAGAGRSPFRFAAETSEAANLLERGGERHWAWFERVFEGLARACCGDATRAEALLLAIAARAEEARVQFLIDGVELGLGTALARKGAHAEAEERLERVARAATIANDHTSAGLALALYAHNELLRGRPQAAERAADEAIGKLFIAPFWRALALAILARARVARGAIRPAFDAAERASQIRDSLGLPSWIEPLCRLALVEVLAASGRRPEALAMAREARAWVLTFAEDAPDEAARAAYLALEENARILAFAAEEAGDGRGSSAAG